jgi:hypothetical protein
MVKRPQLPELLAQFPGIPWHCLLDFLLTFVLASGTGYAIVASLLEVHNSLGLTSMTGTCLIS